MNEYVDLGDRTSIACVYHPGVVVDWFEFAAREYAWWGERRGALFMRLTLCG